VTIHLPDEANLHRWHVTLQGPASTPYSGGQFGLVVTLPPEYPFKAPAVTFATRVYHPNVTNDSNGNICIAQLKPENWKPAGRLAAVLDAVRQLLVEPNPDDPLEARIADEYRHQRGLFEKTAREYVQRYARGPPRFDGPPAAGGAGQ
jgi:ubiquitin-conjugating enzyme E2 D/E